MLPYISVSERSRHPAPAAPARRHTPVHASWLNQIEIYFSIVQRKLLSPSNFARLDELQDALLRFQDYYQAAARPFEWRFTRRDRAALLERLAQYECPLGKAA